MLPSLLSVEALLYSFADAYPRELTDDVGRVWENVIFLGEYVPNVDGPKYTDIGDAMAEKRAEDGRFKRGSREKRGSGSPSEKRQESSSSEMKTRVEKRDKAVHVHVHIPRAPRGK